jgi:hypothetical protein
VERFLQHDIPATLMHGIFEGHPVLYIYELTSALGKNGLFVIFYLISPSLYLKITRGASSVSIITYFLIGLHVSRSSTFWPGTALHCIRELESDFHGWIQ